MSDKVIYSQLLKADYLIGNSQVFPTLVRAACAQEQVTYSEDALAFAATRPAILNALEMTEETILDDVLRGFGWDEDAAGIMDALVIEAVQQYKASIIGEENGNN